MDQNNPNRMYAALGLAGQAGCLAVGLAIGALVLGVWLDQTFGTRRTWALICVLVSVPVNLFITLYVTQRLIARIIPPDKPRTGADAAKKANVSRDDD
jgi:hypothetical protein